MANKGKSKRVLTGIEVGVRGSEGTFPGVQDKSRKVRQTLRQVKESQNDYTSKRSYFGTARNT